MAYSSSSFPLRLSLLSIHLPTLSHPKSLIPFLAWNRSDTLEAFKLQRLDFRPSYRRSIDFFERYSDCEDCSFDQAVSLFNSREFYRCHDLLEELWNRAEEPRRTLIHGIIQCAVGFYHLFNKNHRGAMMELGEGLCKLRKMNFTTGPFHQFEEEISAALDFIYQTQLELAACTDELCLAMDGSERSYQLLGSFAAGRTCIDWKVILLASFT